MTISEILKNKIKNFGVEIAKTRIILLKKIAKIAIKNYHTNSEMKSIMQKLKF